MDKLRIQIVNYKTREYLLDCLASIASDIKDLGEQCSIAILENASGEKLNDIPGLFPGNKIEIFESGKNLGFGGGHNLLAGKGRAEYLLILNPDTELVEPNTVKRLIERAAASKAAAVGPRLITKTGETQEWDHGELHGFRARMKLRTGSGFWRKRETVTEAAWVSGAVLLMEKKWFDDLGGFDEHFFLYKEEEELSWRLREKGGKIIYDPTISVFHHGGVVADKSDHMRESTSYFLDKHFRHRPGYWLLKRFHRQ